MSDSLITIAENGNRLDRFKQFIAATTDALNAEAKIKGDYFRTRVGEKLEYDILDAMKAKAPDFNFSPDKIEHTDKQHFPDIMSEDYFGVEVKSTKSNHWKSIGSSIVESLREDSVKKVFLMFGKLPQNAECKFMCKPYEECLFDITITHSPRYQINMETPVGQTIFDKLGEKYDDFRKDPNKIKIIRSYYRQYYEEKGSMPWWIEDKSEAEDNDVDNYFSKFNGAKFWNDIDDEGVKTFLLASIYQLFPEVIKKKSPLKYKKASLWLCSRYFVVNPSFRDTFSAAGRGKFIINGNEIIDDVPKALCVFILYYDLLIQSFDYHFLSYDEIPIYASYYKPCTNYKKEWLKKIEEYWNEYETLPISFEEFSKMDITAIKKEKSGSSYKYVIHLKTK